MLRIMPESYPNHTSNFQILNLASFARAELVFYEHKSFLRNHSPRATPPGASEKNPTAAAPCSSTLQRHPAMAPTCQLQSACAHHFNCSNLKQHPKAPPCSGTSGPAPERAGHCCSSNLQQRAAAPYASTLAAPSSITLAPPPAG